MHPDGIGDTGQRHAAYAVPRPEGDRRVDYRLLTQSFCLLRPGALELRFWHNAMIGEASQ